MKNIAVIGTGYVGSVSGACLADFGNKVTCIDNNAEKIEAFKKGIIPIFEPELDTVVERNLHAGRLSFSTDLKKAVTENEVVFIAVGTPPQEDGGADLSHVEAAVREIASAMEQYTVIVNKSTVPIGTGKMVETWVKEELKKTKKNVPFDIVSNPEFLREGSAVFDFTHPDRVIIGSESAKAREIMKDVYHSLYLNETPYIETNIESAEMIKYASNAFLALKISFINEIANLCEKVGADVNDISRALGRDGRISPKFLHPGPGYGGSCFPKDTRALVKIGRDAGTPVSVIETAIKANENQKLLQVKKIEDILSQNGSPLNGKTAAILGLAFKPNTDDMRESPAITICEKLAAKGIKLRIYDPAAMKEAKWRLEKLQDSVYYADDEYDAVSGSDAFILLTEWNQFRNLDLSKIKQLLKQPYFFDLRNVYSKETAEAAGLKYFCTGRP